MAGTVNFVNQPVTRNPDFVIGTRGGHPARIPINSTRDGGRAVPLNYELAIWLSPGPILVAPDGTQYDLADLLARIAALEAGGGGGSLYVVVDYVDSGYV